MSLRRFLVGVVAVTLSGCVDNDRSLTITKFVDPMEGCVIDGTATLGKIKGVWDVGLAATFDTSYAVFFGIKNALMPLSSSPIEQQAFYVNSYDVQLEPIGAVEAAVPSGRREFNVPVGSQRLGPGDTGGDAVVALPADLAKGLAALSADPLGTIVVHVRPVATRAEEQVHGAYAGFPVEICNGCLTENFGPCPVPAGTMIDTGGVCGLQDEPITCCESSAGLICGAAVPIAMPTAGP
jgi:hypothetical protein